MYLSLSDWRERRQVRTDAPGTPFRLSPVVVSLGIVSLLTDISSESVAAVLPLYITGALGLSMVAYGFLEGLHQGLSAVVRIAAGYAADRTDRPKPVAFLGYGLSMLARVGLVFAQGFGAISVAVGADRIGKGIRTAPRDAMVQHASQPEHLARSFGVHRMLDTIGATVGPLLAFLILFLVPDGYRAVFIASIAFAVVGLAVLGLLVPNVRLSARPAAGSTDTAGADDAAAPETAGPPGEAVPGQLPLRPGFRTLLTAPMRRLLAVAGLLGLLTVGDGFVYLALMEHGHLDPLWFPLLFVGTNAVFLLLAVPLGRAADRTSRAAVFVLGHLALAAAYACAAAGGTLAAILGCLVLLGVFYAATDGVLAALAGERSPRGAQSTGISAAQTVVAVARLAASTAFGVLWVLFGAVPTMVGAAVVLALAVPVALWLVAGPGRPAPTGTASRPEDGEPAGADAPSGAAR